MAKKNKKKFPPGRRKKPIPRERSPSGRESPKNRATLSRTKLDALVAEVQIQIDAAEWRTVDLNIADANGKRDWWYRWVLPKEDGVQHALQYRAYDYAGNVITSTTPYTTVVDTVAPALNVTNYVPTAQVGNTTPVLSGTITDGHGVAGLRVLAYPAVGAGIELTAE